MRKQLFELGQLVQTAGVDERRKRDGLFDLFCASSLEHFRYGDWGNMCDEDMRSNEEALKNGERLMGVYTHNDEFNNWKIYIITEADRSHTTLLFPEEY